MADQPLPPTPPTSGRGYPGRAALNHAESRLRAVLAKLARDPDTIDQAAELAERAAQALAEITQDAHHIEERSPRARARARRQQQRLAGLFERRGRPLPPSLAALVDQPEAPRERP